jgi:outer membrane biosynthesis protein TonB
MVSKDQTIGALIFLVCAVVAIGYVVALFWPEIIVNTILNWGYDSGQLHRVEFWLVALPVLVAFVVVLAIGAWIGWTMATTPPPKPLEEIEAEEKAEEKVEEVKPEEKAEEKPEPTEKAETEKEKKRKK